MESYNDVLKTYTLDESNVKQFCKTCECGEEFYSRSTFYRHKRDCTKSISTGMFLCKENDCKFNSRYADSLHQHLRHIHGIDCKEEIKNFNNYLDFLNWKEEYEKETKSSYVLRSRKKPSSGTKVYFYCNRSGKYSSVSTGKRTAKSQGLSKIGFNCPARLIVHDSKESEKVTVYVHHYHYGHDNQLAHIRIAKRDRDNIAHQLTQGISPSSVLTNLIPENETNLQRKHLLTKRDILNICKSYGIERHSEDQISLDAYVKENLENERSIFLYKKQGEEVFQYPDDKACFLEKNDFVLGVMTTFQKQMLQQFGNNIVSVDATHGSNMSEFNLITILVVDEFKEAIPVAWLVCNKENDTVLRLFFSNIKKEVGDIHPEIFMSDKASHYFNAWKGVFQGQTKECIINTNMFVKSFRKMIKYGIYCLNSKRRKRVDKCLFVLLKFAKDLAIKRLTKLEHENTLKLSKIGKCHRLALTLPTTLLKQTSSMTWEVQSEKCLDAETSDSGNQSYIVKEEPVCNKKCQIICQECNICLHSYSCTCSDALTRTNICKHIHLVNHYQKTTVEKIEIEDTNIEYLKIPNSNSSRNNHEEDQNFIYEIIIPKTEEDNEDLKISLLEKTTELYEKIQNCDEKGVLLAVKQHIQSAISILNMPKEHHTKIMKRKRTNPQKNVKYSKPSIKEQTELQKQILTDFNSDSNGEDETYTIEVSSIMDTDLLIQQFM